MSTTAVIENLLVHLAPGVGELVLFDINRNSAAASILVTDPGPLTAQLMADDSLPFHITLITNEHSQTRHVVSQRKPPFSNAAVTLLLNELAWPPAVLSLSHVALPFPPSDPLYGRERPTDPRKLHLGQIPVQGERGLLNFPAESLLRLRHNPFFSYLQDRTEQWLTAVGLNVPPTSLSDQNSAAQ